MLPRHSRARASKTARLKVAAAPKPRPRFNEGDTRNLKTLLAEKWGFEPKDFQITAVKAQIEGVDMIVQASTGAGKTAIAAGPHLWPGNEGKFTIMTCPLLSLEEEMVQTFENEYGLKAIALNSKNGGCEPQKIDDILALKYQVILISPEMLQSRTFHSRVLQRSSFMRNMISMFIDEAHCIVHWGADFRKQYGTLGKLQTFFPRGTPVIAVSATLTPRVVRAIHRSLCFTQSDAQWRFVNKGNDRPNVSLVVRACEHTLNSYADLDFLITSTIRDPTDIPKTYLYVDNISIGSEIIDHLNTLILTRVAAVDSAGQPLSGKAQKRLRGIVRPFNATLSSSYRTRAMARFRSGHVRILVCTDAAGMGCNVPDVDRVVQWKLPQTFSHWIQRAGRAARGPGRTGIAVLLVERSAYSVDLIDKPSDPVVPVKPSSTKSKKTSATAVSDDTSGSSAQKRNPKLVREYVLAHGLARGASNNTDEPPSGKQPCVGEEDTDEGLHAFVQSVVCRRKVWATAFDSGIAKPTVPCCDLCDPALLNQTRPPVIASEKRSKPLKRGELDLNARDKVYTWRETVYAREHPFSQYDETGILQDELIEALVSHGPLTPDQVADMLKGKWVFWERHGANLSTLIQSLDIKFKALPSKPRRPAKKAQAPPPDTSITSDPKYPQVPADASHPLPGGSQWAIESRPSETQPEAHPQAYYMSSFPLTSTPAAFGIPSEHESLSSPHPYILDSSASRPWTPQPAATNPNCPLPPFHSQFSHAPPSQSPLSASMWHVPPQQEAAGYPVSHPASTHMRHPTAARPSTSHLPNTPSLQFHSYHAALHPIDHPYMSIDPQMLPTSHGAEYSVYAQRASMPLSESSTEVTSTNLDSSYQYHHDYSPNNTYNSHQASESVQSGLLQTSMAPSQPFRPLTMPPHTPTLSHFQYDQYYSTEEHYEYMEY